MARIDEYLEEILKRDASDLHFMAGDPPRYRLYGNLSNLRAERLGAEFVREALYEIMPRKALERFETRDGTLHARAQLFDHSTNGELTHSWITTLPQPGCRDASTSAHDSSIGPSSQDSPITCSWPWARKLRGLAVVTSSSRVLRRCTAVNMT